MEKTSNTTHEKKLRVGHALRKLSFLAIAGSVIMAGCGGQANKNRTVDLGRTGVDNAKQVDELDNNEIDTLCKAARDTFLEHTGSSYELGLCTLTVGASAPSVSDCEERVKNECDAGSASVEVDVASCVDDLSTLGTCDVSVGELEDCLDAQVDSFDSIAALSCESVVGSNSDAFYIDALPATCQALSDRCPDLFSGETEVDPGVIEPPPSNAVSGTVDGESVMLPLASYSIKSPGFEREQTMSIQSAAALNLWGDGESTQGLLQMPEDSPLGSVLVCLDDVQLQSDDSGQFVGWSSSSLSVLGECNPDGGLPLELEFDGGGPVNGELNGEAINWTQAGGFSCGVSNLAGGAGCTFSFNDDAGYVELNLEFDSFDFDREMKVISSTLIRSGDGLSVACGGSGTALLTSDEHFTAKVDEYSAPLSCPGDALDGELSGTL